MSPCSPICSPPAAVSPPPEFAGDSPGPKSPPRHFIWPPPCEHIHDMPAVVKQPLRQLNCNNSGYLIRGFVNSSRGVSGKRKSAVELLQESKAFYVKTEHVLDKKQELKNSGHLHVTSPAVDLFLKAPANGCNGKPLSSSPPSGHQRTVSLDKASTLPPKLPERSGSHSPPPLPPKSPRIAAARPRAKTVTEVRRSHSHCADDVQMKLRRLLSSSSSVEQSSQEEKAKKKGPRYRRLLDDEDDEDNSCLELELSLGELERDDCCFEDSSPPFDSKTVAGERVYLRSRHSTPTAHPSRSFLSPATYKSLPDLSPMVHTAATTTNTTESSTTTPGSDEEETSGGSSGKNRSRYSPRATSDYVSRSPSSCKCCRGGRSAPCSEAGSAPARARLSPDDDEFSEGSGDSVAGACRTNGSRQSSPRAESQPGGPRSPSPSSTRRRPILRSKSDISHRYSRAAFLAPIMRTVADELDDPQLSPPASQPRRSSTEIERFFEQLGLEDDSYKLMTNSKRDSQDSAASPIFFESVSSVDSWPGTTWGGTLRGESGDSGPAPTGPGGSKLGEQPSIVERNARIIKWLCNCRKAQLGALS